MPHINLPLDAGGCLLDFYVGVSSQRQAALQAANQPVPTVIRIRALIDTGASGTAIEETILQQLSLTPTGTANILTPSTKGVAVVCMTYDILAGIYHPAHSLILGTLPVIASNFTGQKIQALTKAVVSRKRAAATHAL